MDDYTADESVIPVLLAEFWKLAKMGRPAFKQDRTFHRAMAMVFGELFTLGRHTVTQVLRTLGETEHDWTAWYRLFSQARMDEQELGRQLVRATLAHIPPDEPYVVTIDATLIPRTGKRIAGSGWLPALNTAYFQRGLRQAQRFVETAWLTPVEDGFCRAIPLRWQAAPTRRANPCEVEPVKEWQAGCQQLTWLRQAFDGEGRAQQLIVGLADGSYDVQGIWSELPRDTIMLVRCARNRALYALPKVESDQSGPGRPRRYGERLPRPDADMRRNKGWTVARLRVRGRDLVFQHRVTGPVLVEGAPDQPLFLIVVRGATWQRGRQAKRRKPAFYLVSAVQREGKWVLPWPAETLLAWAWHRWECEVAHREMKSALGVGEKQCWGSCSALRAVQWGVWVYSLCVLAAYRTWGLTKGPRQSGRWYRRGRRWSFSAMWQAYRSALWECGEYRPLYTPIMAKWLKIETWEAGLGNALAGAARI